MSDATSPDAAMPCATDPSFAPLGQTAALRFDGSTRVTVTRTPGLDLGVSDTTFELWMRSEAAQSTTATILSKRSISGDGFMFGLLREFGHSVWAQFRDVPNREGRSGDLRDRCWHHIAVVRETSGGGGYSIFFYLDGVPTVTIALPSRRDITSPGNLMIGFDRISPPSFVGDVHSVRIWSVARSASEIAAGRFVRVTGGEPGLAGAWPLNEGTGQTTADLVGASGGFLGIDSGPDGNDPTWVALP